MSSLHTPLQQLTEFIHYLMVIKTFRNIEDLTRDVNKMHEEVNELNLENEEMRERLGITSSEELDMNAIRKKKAVKEEQALALNRILQKEVEVLVLLLFLKTTLLLTDRCYRRTVTKRLFEQWTS